MTPTQTAHRQQEAALPIPADPVKAFIQTRLARNETPVQIADAVKAHLGIAIDRNQVIPFWKGEITLPTQTERRQDKESVQIPADEAGEPLFTRMPCAEMPDAVPPVAITEAAPPTRTGPGQEEESLQTPPDAARAVTVPRRAPDDPSAQSTAAAPAIGCAPDPDTPPTRTGPGQEEDFMVILPDEVREFIIEQMARRAPAWLIADDVLKKFGLVVDREEIVVCFRDRDSLPTRTGPGQEKESRPKLNDEVKEFIVKRLACYETPSRVAAAVRSNFGIDIDRRRVFDYDPAGARPPARRWIDLHAATRARFLRDIAEIGIAQKVIRLRMLDRFAEMAEDSNQHEKAARYLQQAARECGGFYERTARPKAAPAPQDVSPAAPTS